MAKSLGLEYKGLCIIPLGRVGSKCKELGYPYEVSNILYLNEMLEYSRKKKLAVYYLSADRGISFADDIMPRDKLKLHSMSSETLGKWSSIIAEEIYRLCVANQTNVVYLMCKVLYNYTRLEDRLRVKGIRVETPLLGLSGSLVLEKLR